MRILFVICPARTHLYAVTPLAWALLAAGHQVRVASQPDEVLLTTQEIAGVGLSAVAVGPPATMGAMVQELVAGRPAPPAPPPGGEWSDQETYADADPYHELDLLARYHLRGFSPDETIDDLVAHARSWRPDLVVWDGMAMGFAGPVAARACGAAHARLVFGTDALSQLRVKAALARPGEDPLRTELEPILRRYGLAFDEDMILGQWTLNAMPPWTWQQPGTSSLWMRPVPFNGPSVVPAWLAEPPHRPRVCITLGLTFREQGVGPPVEQLLKAVSDLDAEVVLTVPAEQIAALPELPDNVRPVDFVPMTALLPTCAAVVHHGGYGTFTTALTYGVPQLIVPGKVGSDKWWGPLAEAQALDRLGAGVYVCDPEAFTADRLRDGLDRVLGDPSFSAAAQRLSTDLLQMPAPSDIVPALEKLTARHQTLQEEPR